MPRTPLGSCVGPQYTRHLRVRSSSRDTRQGRHLLRWNHLRPWAGIVLAVLTPAMAPGKAAPETPPERSPDSTEARQDKPDGWFEVWKKLKADLEETTGTSVSICAVPTNQVILNGPGQGSDRTVFWWNVNVTQKLWAGAKLITNTRGGTGYGLADIDTSKHNTNWSRGEIVCAYVSHLYIEQKLFEDRVTLALGKLDLGSYFDTSAVANWNFLSYTLARSPTIPFPWHALGALARWEPVPWFYLQAGVADAHAGGTETGFNTAFEDGPEYFSVYEFGFRPNVEGRQGNYRFLLWHDPQRRSRQDGNATDKGDVGFALSFDQQITDAIGAFFRYGYAHEELREIEHFWSIGATWRGVIPGRAEDVLAFGVARSIMGGDYRSANGSTKADTLFELYYEIRLTEWLSIVPDVQVILNPGADPDRDVGVIAGLKIAVNL